MVWNQAKPIYISCFVDSTENVRHKKNIDRKNSLWNICTTPKHFDRVDHDMLL